jgi:hypothetical protein
MVTVLAWGCDLPQVRSCRADSECPAGAYCDRPAGEGGLCAQVGPGVVRLEIGEPAAGAVIGPSGTAVQTVLTQPEGAPPAPEKVALLADGEPAAELELVARSAGRAVYGGRYLPRPGIDRVLSLQSAADAVAPALSAPVAVAVDTAPPALTDVQARCDGAPCLRDAELRLSARVADSNPGATVAHLDLDGFARPRALSAGRSGTRPMGDADRLLTGTVPLAEWDFPRFDGDVRVRVVASDALGNSAVRELAVPVTRLAWSKPLPLTSAPAIDDDGTMLASTTDGRLLRLSPEGEVLKSLKVSEKPLTAPAIGRDAVWLGGDKLYAVNRKLEVVLAACDVGDYGTTSVPVVGFAPGEVGYVGTIGVAWKKLDGTPCQFRENAAGVFSMALDDEGIFVARGLDFYRFSHVGSDLGLDWQISGEWNHHLALGRSGVLLAGGNLPHGYAIRRINRLTGVASEAYRGREASTNLVVDRSGAAFVGDVESAFHMVKPDGTVLTIQQSVDKPTVLLLVEPSKSGVFVQAGTEGGVMALRRDGVAWRASLDGGVTDLAVLPAMANRLPRLMARSAHPGGLHAVVIDSGLDTVAPWPKANRDARNSGNAAFPR